MPTTKPFALLAAVAAAFTAVLAGPVSSSTAAPTACSAPGSDTAVTWVGGSSKNPTSWSDPSNWSTDAVPDPVGDGTYADSYVCIGGSAAVTLDGAQYIDGLALSGSAHLTVTPTGNLSLGSNSDADSGTAHGTKLIIDGGLLSGSGNLTVAGVIELEGKVVSHKGHAGTQSGFGTTKITFQGEMKVDGSSWGQTQLSAGREVDNFGTISFANKGFLEMGDSTSLIDEKDSNLDLDGKGGIYRTTPTTTHPPTITQEGKISEVGASLSIVGVPVHFAGASVSVKKGGALFDATALPSATMVPDTSYGIGGCEVLKNQLCIGPETDAGVPQGAMVTTSTAAPAKQTIRLKLVGSSPVKVKGHGLLGKEVSVTAPMPKTTHSTHLTLTFDASTKGVTKGLKPNVYRNGHKITYCSQHGVTAVNPQCVKSAKTLSSPSPSKGDLQLFIITIKPKATWAVTVP